MSLCATVLRVPAAPRTPPIATLDRSRVAAAVEWSLLAVGLTLLAVGQAHGLFGDDLVRKHMLDELWGHGHLTTDPYSLVGPLLATPFWWLDRITGGDGVWLGYVNVTLFALGLGCAYRLLYRRIDAELLRRFLLTLVATTMIARFVSLFAPEVFTGLAIGLGVVAVVMGTRRAVRLTGWVAIVLGTANTPAVIVGVAAVCVAEVLARRRLRFLLPIVAAVALIGAENWLRRGSPVNTGYADAAPVVPTVMPYSAEHGFSYPFVLGVAAILFSFGKGVLWYAPGLVLPVRRRLCEPALGRVYVYWMLLVVGLVVVYASWWSWYGGVGWGPRFFMIAILPASLGLALALGDRRIRPLASLATLAVLALSVWVAADSFAFGQLLPPECRAYQPLEMLCHFTPEFSALWYPFLAAPPLGRPEVVAFAFYAVVLIWLAAPVLVRLFHGSREWSRSTALPWLGTAPWRW